jgi:hypothetical protein
MEYLKARLQQHFPSFNRQHSAFKILPTYDIDEAYSFKHKSWWRSTGGAVKDLYKGNFNRYRQRRRVLSGKIQDPFDSYDWLDDLHERYNLEPRYFFLVADKTGKYDRNILPREGALRALIYRHADRYKIGVHPSWQSGDQPELVKKEIQTVADAGGINVDSSRQHFIRFTLPGTYRQLIEAGITEDFSMGYGSINGFRASVVAPFYWFDLEKEQATKLLLYPFCFMEANSFFEQKQSPEQALEEMLHYYRVIKEVNGLMVMIWHNTFLGTDELFKGWRVCYERFWSELVRGY